MKNNVQRALIFDVSGEAAEERYIKWKAPKNIIPAENPNSVHVRHFRKFQIELRYVLTAAHNLYDKILLLIPADEGVWIKTHK